MIDNEKFYDEEIAPALLEIADKLKARGMSFVATVEYEKDKRGSTRFVNANSGLAMVMLDHLDGCGENVDAFMIRLIRHAKEHGIDYSQSMFMTMAEKETK